MALELIAGLSVDEFLNHSFDPKCELLGGETRPKPLGTGKHSKMQRRLLRLLEGIFGEGFVEFELSVRIAAEVLVPDLVVLRSRHPRMYRDVLDEPPLLCIEVLSPSQLPAEMLAKCERYQNFGVPYCWVIDPVGGRAWECHRQSGPREVFHALGGPCDLALPQVFAE